MKARWSTILIAISVCLVLLALPHVDLVWAADRSSSTPRATTSNPTVSAPRPGSVSRALVDDGTAEAAGVSLDVLHLALGAIECATKVGAIERPPTLTLIDYSRPSTEPRLWVFDLATGELLFRELVAHGKNTGENYAEHFSDDFNSHQSSLGLFVTGDTYVGTNGYSLRMDGLEPGFNGRARERAVVMHGAPYVDASLAAKQGRIGRSWGCPALREAIARNVIDTVRGGGVVFSYYPDPAWLQRSRFLQGCDSPAVATH